MKETVLLLIYISLSLVAFSQEGRVEGFIVDKSNGEPVSTAEIFIDETGETFEVNDKGIFVIPLLEYGDYVFQVFASGYSTLTYPIKINSDFIEMKLELEKLNIQLGTATVTDEKNNIGVGKLRNVEEFGLYGGKKSEVIRIESIVANVATNNPREIFKGISGLNIHENDGAGLQLSIGGRGLDPNRTANFNTRQNGYDISADALGYPESYYTPPVQALKKIEIVRGAASLQYGPQFGGLLNFVFKEGRTDKPFHFTHESTYGSNHFFNTFNSVDGQVGKLNYYSFFQFKRGEGYRPFSDFKQKTGFVKLKFAPNEKWKISGEYTHMDYISRQPGGLQDFDFENDPFQSLRERNWFKVGWDLAALDFTYYMNSKTRINSRAFLLSAGRSALGELAPINRPDPVRERDLISGQYFNFGNETRFVRQYELKENTSTFITGIRYYQGRADNDQGFASDGSEDDFEFIPEEPNISSYRFPSRNFSFFAENLFMLSPQWSITPGIRLEWIRTSSDGYFYNRIYSGDEIVFEEKIPDAGENKRWVFLSGLGVSYKPKDELEIYANFSQNYRPINFTDLSVVNPNIIVDSLMQDEKGFNFDLGMRGGFFDGKLRVDMTLFALRYNNRIGVKDIVVQNEIGVNQLVDYRTNIGDALIVGWESYLESDVVEFFSDDSDFACVVFSNLAIISGKYLNGGTDIKGNNVELIPPVNWKTGFTFSWKNLKSSFQYSHVSRHFSDATNAEFVANATRGIIPAYSIVDFSVSYKWKMLTFSGGINNLTDEHYFTRRTASYPGPGIIPAQGRNYYVSLKMDW